MSSNRTLVPNAKENLNAFKGQVMKEKGYHVDPAHPENVKYEVADELGVPLKKGYNGNLTSKQAGTVGGHIGGPMVADLIKMAQHSLAKKNT